MLFLKGAVRVPIDVDEDLCSCCPVANDYKCQSRGRWGTMATRWQCGMWEWARIGEVGVEFIETQKVKAGAENVCGRRPADSVCGNIQVVSFLFRYIFVDV